MSRPHNKVCQPKGLTRRSRRESITPIRSQPGGDPRGTGTRTPKEYTRAHSTGEVAITVITYQLTTPEWNTNPQGEPVSHSRRESGMARKQPESHQARQCSPGDSDDTGRRTSVTGGSPEEEDIQEVPPGGPRVRGTTDFRLKRGDQRQEETNVSRRPPPSA